MKTSTGLLERRKFSQLHQEGKSYQAIAEQFGVSAMCVRMWCRRQRDGQGVEDRYHNPRSGVLSQFGEAVREQIVAMKRDHPGWGPESIRLHLGKEEAWPGRLCPAGRAWGATCTASPSSAAR